MSFSIPAFLMKAAVPALLLGASAVNAAANIDTASLGATTALSTKQATMCSVLDYGGVADGETDIGPAITKAFTSCVSGNSATLYIPEGNYSMATGVTLANADGWAFQLDGLITLTSDGDFNGNAILIEKGSDIEVFSSNNLGAINGQGYIKRKDDTSQIARLMRFMTVTDLSVHNIILIDSPTFHLVFNGITNLDMYYITVRGGDLGGTDGIDLECDGNCHLHDFEVTNRDECVSVKTPSTNVLIENAYCNQAGGMSIGSLTADITDSSDAAAVSNITMRNIYVYQNTQMLMIKTFPGGSGATGYVQDCLFENFWAYDTTYALDIDQYWQSTTSPDTGAVALSGLTFSNWTGTMNNGEERGAIVIRGSDIVPVQDVTLENFDMWTVNGDMVVNQCKNVYGDGYCIQATTGSATYTTSVTSTASPTGFTAPASPTWAVAGYGTTDPIPVYTPAVWWPTSSGAASASATTTAASVSSTAVDVVLTSASSTTVSPASTSASSSAVVSSVATSASSSAVVTPATTSAPSSTTVAAVSTSASSSYSKKSKSRSSKASKSSSSSFSSSVPVLAATSYSTSYVSAVSSAAPVPSANSSAPFYPSGTAVSAKPTGTGVFSTGGFPHSHNGTSKPHCTGGKKSSSASASASASFSDSAVALAATTLATSTGRYPVNPSSKPSFSFNGTAIVVPTGTGVSSGFLTVTASASVVSAVSSAVAAATSAAAASGSDSELSEFLTFFEDLLELLASYF